MVASVTQPSSLAIALKRYLSLLPQRHEFDFAMSSAELFYFLITFCGERQVQVRCPFERSPLPHVRLGNEVWHINMEFSLGVGHAIIEYTLVSWHTGGEGDQATHQQH